MMVLQRSASKKHGGNLQQMMERSAAIRTFTREFIERTLSQKCPKSILSIPTGIVDAWEKLSFTDVQYYEARGKKLLDRKKPMSEPLERGFMLYFLEELKAAEETDSPGYNDRDIHFFDDVFDQYQELPQKIRTKYRKRATQNIGRFSESEITTELQIPSDDLRAKLTKSVIYQELDTEMQQHELDTYSLEQLEDRLAAETTDLKQLREKLSSVASAESKDWQSEIESILLQCASKPIKMAFLGATGTGKSSLINAVLEAKLLTEDSSRSCTACPIEISYADFSTNAFNIRITVEFIDETSWRREVEEYYTVLQENIGSSTDTVLHDSDFEQMRDKIQVLCPDIPFQKHRDMSCHDILRHRNVAEHLGTVTEKTFDDTESAYHAIEEYVWGQGSTDLSADAATAVPLWPLIQLTRIETDNKVLKHGITLVDLPGTQDLNKARAAVAERQMKESSAVCIVTPSIRAVDDAVAGDLLTQALKHNFHQDGISLLIIGTKTDDIGAPQDVARRLQIKDKVDGLERRWKDLANDIAQSQKQEEKLKMRLKAIQEDLDGPDRFMSIHGICEATTENGQPVPELAIWNSCRKRKRTLSDVAYSSNDGKLPSNPTDINATPPTVKELNASNAIEPTQMTFAQRKKIFSDLMNELSQVKTQRTSTEKLKATINLQMYQICIQARNRSVEKGLFNSFVRALQHHYDTESGQQIDKTEGSDVIHDAMATSATALKVIMVSAKAHEVLCRKRKGWAIDDGSSSLNSFTKAEQTGVPALQEYCESLAVMKRRKHAERMLKTIAHVRTGMHLWASGTPFAKNMTAQQLAAERGEVMKIFWDETKAMQVNFVSTEENIQKFVNSIVLRKIPEARDMAKASITGALAQFGASIKSAMRYRAILVREGKYICPDGKSYDLNRALLQPFIEFIKPEWKEVFGNETDPKIPNEIATYRILCKSKLDLIAEVALTKAKALGCPASVILKIQQQCSDHKRNIRDNTNAYHQDIQFGQRTVQKQLLDSIQTGFSPAYKDARAVKGKGSLDKMKVSLENQAQILKSSVFQNIADELGTDIHESLRDSGSEAKTRNETSFWKLKRDLLNIFKPSNVKVSPTELKIRREIANMLDQHHRDISGEEVMDNTKSAGVRVKVEWQE